MKHKLTIKKFGNAKTLIKSIITYKTLMKGTIPERKHIWRKHTHLKVCKILQSRRVLKIKKERESKSMWQNIYNEDKNI